MDEEFDGLQYIASYGDPDQAFGANADAGERRLPTRFGRAERRQSDDFDEVQYLANYPDLQTAFGDDGGLATLHFINFGYGEGRNPNPPPPPGFDPLQYIASHADLIDAFGASPELRRAPLPSSSAGPRGARSTPSTRSSTSPTTTDLATALNNDPGAATLHYILFGKNENRTDAEAGNTPPAAVDDTLTVSEDDGATPVDVLANDSDLDAGDARTVVAVSNAGTRGLVALAPGGAVSYDPATPSSAWPRASQTRTASATRSPTTAAARARRPSRSRSPASTTRRPLPAMPHPRSPRTPGRW